MNPIERVLAKIPGKAAGRNQWEAKCPAHEDRRASLSISVGSDGKVILHCHAGCATEAVVGAVGLTMSDLFPEDRTGTDTWTPRGAATDMYPYVDENGVVLYEVCRTANKEFPQRRPDPTSKSGYAWKLDGVRRVPFHLPQLLKAVRAGRGIFVPEGEKDVGTLERLGLCATCNSGGAGQWREEFTPFFKGATVYVLPDNDDAGRNHAEDVARKLYGTAKEIRVVPLPGLPTKGDVTDFIANGGTAEQLKELVGAAPLWAAGELTASTIEPGKERRSALRSLAEILSDPTALNGPEEVVPRFAWRGRVTLLAGREKLGKSTLAGAAASAVSSGGRFIGQEVQAGPVLIVGLEEHVSDLASRLNDFGADPGRLFVLDTLSHGKPFEAIEEAVAEVTEKAGAAPRLVVVDTLPRLAEGLVQESGSASQWSPVMSALTAIARTSNAALVLLHHARKSDGGYRDSTAVGAGVDAIIEMDQTPQDDECARKFRVKARWRTSDFSLRLIGTQYESVSGAVSPETKALFWVQANPGCSHREIREGVGGEATDVDAAVKRLLAQGLIRDGGTPQAHAYHPVSSDSTRDTLRDTPTVSQLTPLGPTTDTVGTTPRTKGCVPIPNPNALSGTHPEAAPEGGEVWEVTT